MCSGIALCYSVTVGGGHCEGRSLCAAGATVCAVTDRLYVRLCVVCVCVAAGVYGLSFDWPGVPGNNVSRYFMCSSPQFCTASGV